MPDILTRANKQPHVIYGNEYYCPYSGWFWRSGEPDCRRCKVLLVESARGKENGLPTPENALERDSAQSSPIPAGSVNGPETIRISLPALRAVILGVIDDGDSGAVWRIDDDDADIENDARMRFCDGIQRQLRRLQ